MEILFTAFAACGNRGAAFILFVMNDDQRERIKSMLGAFDFKAIAAKDPNEQWPTYQQWRGRTALANGGFAGQGFLNGDFTQNGIVPYGFNDLYL